MVLCPVIGKLLGKRVVLASASPRRQEILIQAGLRFEVVPSRFKETLDKASFPTPYAYAIETAKQKALEVAHRMHLKDLRTPEIVIGADTIVAVGGLILEKPVDKQDAYRILSRLNGKEHSVFTGVAIVHCSSPDGLLETEVCEFHEETKVTFSELSEELLWEYIHSGEPMDKAGGYGIQALGGMLVECVHGDFLNVVGFPLNHFCKKLAELYYPPRAGAVQRAKDDSIPAVDTFEDLSDEGGGGEGAGAAETPGLEEAGGEPRARGDAGRNRTAQTVLPIPWDLLELIDDFKASKALFTASKLRVFDLLRDGAVLNAANVAGKIEASVCGTGRLLDACAGLGLLRKTERGYSNTESANLYLTSDGERSLHGVVMHCDEHTWNLFTHLEFAVREGTNENRRAFGKEAEGLFQDSCYHSEEAKLRLLRAMHGLSKLTAPHVASAFDLFRFSSACDLGGCTGALAHELIQEYPHLKVTVFDLPEVIEHVSCFQLDRQQQTAQISFVSEFCTTGRMTKSTR
ncbi:probable bifunctional dTTP/UTP pyrophosphatase/methyltransferase protein isoform X2 [Choloepus didactylus]|uniref:probable bifunctional dTTP/UTP pyrophosphatase/methyltransferase protein isoform X2 n=1 Tax=Choloepus didactylus TaxID=27675 RepID=UPI0018A1187B|nr:probable bifunctional dTTP/UTP pyrophosphatase/methyltransferase protein isoform X2 [Choloepus didactylus]